VPFSVFSSCEHYNKRCPCMPIDFTGFWVNSLVVVNGDQWKNNEFIGLVNGDQWTAPTFCSGGNLSICQQKDWKKVGFFFSSINLTTFVYFLVKFWY